MMLATVVDGDALLQAVAASVIAGVGITILFSLGVYGATQWAEARRDGRSVAASAAGTLSVVALAAALAAVIVAIVLMAAK
jgi:predicted transporter